jgi:hypothetical protein
MKIKRGNSEYLLLALPTKVVAQRDSCGQGALSRDIGAGEVARSAGEGTPESLSQCNLAGARMKAEQRRLLS